MWLRHGLGGWGRGVNLRWKASSLFYVFYCQQEDFSIVCEINGAVQCDWFPKWVRRYFCKIAITVIAEVALRVAKKVHKNKKWLVSSIPWLQRNFSEGVSMKLWRYFFLYLKELRPTLSWKRYRSPKGLCIPKIHFFFGRIKDKIWFLRTLKMEYHE